jgi:hypothetical protein
VTVTGGWYDGARRVDAHPGRVGMTIDPEVIVVHTTDCMPGSMPAIVRSWSSVAGNGACAHFIIGRDAASGVVQLIPTNRNANHAGGSPKHGWYQVPHPIDPKFGPEHVHPNTIAIGIELDCAGYLGRPLMMAGRKVWYHPDTRRAVADVDVDEHGRGWHRVTTYQYEALGRLIDELRRWIRLPRIGLTIAPNGGYQDNGVPWAAMTQSAVVGHATLDPTNKTDPGAFVMAWIRSRYGA